MMRHLTSIRFNWTVIIFITIIIVHCGSLLTFPTAFVDEGLTASRAAAFYKDNIAFGEIEKGGYDRIKNYQYSFRFISSLFYALPTYLTKQVTLSSIRVVNLIWGILLLYSVFVIAKVIDGKNYGLCSIAVLASSFPFIFASHVARADIQASAMLYSAIALFLSNVNANLYLSLLSGLLLGFGFEVHPRICIGGPIILSLYFYRDGMDFYKSKCFWFFVLGGVIGLLFFYLVHIYPDPQTFFRITKDTYSSSRMPPVSSLSSLTKIICSFGKLFETYFMLYKWAASLLILEIVFCIIRRQKEEKLLLYLYIFSVASALLFIKDFFIFNIIIISPVFDLVIAHLIFRSFKNLNSNRKAVNIVMSVLVLGIFSASIFKILQSTTMYSRSCINSFSNAESWIKERVSIDDKILGQEVFWLGLQEYRYSSWKNLVDIMHIGHNSNLEQAFIELKPDVLIYDTDLEYSLSDQVSHNLWYENMRISKSEFEKLLKKYSVLEGTLSNNCYSPISIYRFKWN